MDSAVVYLSRTLDPNGKHGLKAISLLGDNELLPITIDVKSMQHLPRNPLYKISASLKRFNPELIEKLEAALKASPDKLVESARVARLLIETSMTQRADQFAFNGFQLLQQIDRVAQSSGNDALKEGVRKKLTRGTERFSLYLSLTREGNIQSGIKAFINVAQNYEIPELMKAGAGLAAVGCVAEGGKALVVVKDPRGAALIGCGVGIVEGFAVAAVGFRLL